MHLAYSAVQNRGPRPLHYNEDRLYPQNQSLKICLIMLVAFIKMSGYTTLSRKLCAASQYLDGFLDVSLCLACSCLVCHLQANLVKQQARLESATTELNAAQAILDDKQKELDIVQALYDSAMSEKQVS